MNSKIRAVFRTDASSAIGTGHVRRCLALAQALAERGAQVVFVSRSLHGDQAELIRSAGITLLSLPRPLRSATAGNDTPHADWLGVHWETDAEQTLAALDGLGEIDWLVVDHYALERDWERALRGRVRKIMVIDDLADRVHDCDLLLDQNLFERPEGRYKALVSPDARLLLGPAYALMRPEFQQARRNVRVRDGRVEKILVFMGGVDAAGVTLPAVRALIPLLQRDMSVDVVVSPACPDFDRVKDLCALHPALTLHPGTDRMAQLMAASDLAIGAGGSASWERACLGLPAVLVPVAENQMAVSAELAEHGAVLRVTPSASIEDDLRRTVDVLISQPALMRSMSRCNSALADGRGLRRVTALLLEQRVTLRAAAEKDRDSVFEWRNAPLVVENSLNPKPIPREAHDRWYTDTLQAQSRALLLAEYDGETVGVLRFDFEPAQATVSIYLTPRSQGQGWGRAILREGECWLKTYKPETIRILATVVSGNVPSEKLFLEAGFSLKSSNYEKVLH
ncbi:MAG: UDP-2,4-diacetamido-2,4,6-trideoxy-beta-L-altropyranose hydrolase [Nevskiaceae bacterium]|nr:MAG: UDP-2,4-diacetamido-2,4,6-trideoxy-beta-L-altropyranose hydrolase [Nevskiaceae bacterium]